MQQKKSIPKKTEKLIYQEAGNKCSFCEEDNVHVLEIHHIVSREEGGTNEPGNLLLVCANCHSKVTSEVISKDEVMAKKSELIYTRPRKSTGPSTTHVLSVAGDVSGSIFANVMNFPSSGKKVRKPKINYPIDSIGADLKKKNYLDYLIRRYYEYRQADKSFGASGHATKFHYSEIHTSIAKIFKAKTFFIPIHRFDEVCLYVQSRIDKTILGRNNKSKGIKNYSGHQEYLLEQGYEI